MKSAASSYTMIARLRLEEIENVTKHSIDQRGAAGSEAGSGDNENDVDSGPNSFRKKIIEFIRREREKEEGGDGRDEGDEEGDERAWLLVNKGVCEFLFRSVCAYQIRMPSLRII